MAKIDCMVQARICEYLLGGFLSSMTVKWICSVSQTKWFLRRCDVHFGTFYRPQKNVINQEELHPLNVLYANFLSLITKPPSPSVGLC